MMRKKTTKTSELADEEDDHVGIIMLRREWRALTTSLREFNKNNPDHELQLGRLPWMVIAHIEARWEIAELRAQPASGLKDIRLANDEIDRLNILNAELTRQLKVLREKVYGSK